MRANGLNILIDAGVTASRISKALSPIGVSLDDIDAVFITHEHGDHCRALETFSKYEKMRVFACEETYELISYHKPATQKLRWTLFTSGQSFKFKSLSVSTYAVPHDVPTVAYRIDTGRKSFVWMTDLGKPTILAKEIAKSAQILVLESNYCPKMLEKSKRPMSLKSRISGSHGHLSNADAISILEAIDPDFVEHIFLAHVSKECNSVGHIAELISPLPEALRGKIEIVCPYDGCKTPYFI